MPFDFAQGTSLLGALALISTPSEAEEYIILNCVKVVERSRNHRAFDSAQATADSPQATDLAQKQAVGVQYSC